MIDRHDIEKLYEMVHIPKLFLGSLAKDSSVKVSVEGVTNRSLRKKEYKPNVHSISQAFTATRANPHDRLRREIINKTFTYYGEVRGEKNLKPDPDDQNVINHSPESLEGFVQHSITSALVLGDVAKSSLDEIDTERAHFVLGDKGVGKTHLQNFIVSNFWRDFDKNQVMWIRINLIRDYGINEPTLVDWIRAQIAKTICRYFDNSSDYLKAGAFNNKEYDQEREKGDSFVRSGLHSFDIKSLLNSYVTDATIGDELQRSLLLTKMRTMLNCFQKLHEDQDISPDWVPSDFASAIYAHAVSRGFTFIVVLDGLDILSLSSASDWKYKRRLKSVSAYLSQEAVIPCYNIVFTRPETLKDLENVFENNAAPYQPVIDDCSWVYPCDLNQMLFKRLSFLTSTDCPLVIPHSHVEKFENFLSSRDTNEIAQNSLIDRIIDVAGRNARSAIQAVGMASISFSGSFETNYRFTEVAMKGFSPYPPILYSYQYNEDGYLTRDRDIKPIAHDVMFLPSIFGFPFARGAAPDETFEKLGTTSYLWGYRLLQLVQSFEKAGSGIGPKVIGLCDVLEIAYGYPKVRSQLIIEEMLETDALYIKSIDSEARPSNSMDGHINVAPKGLHIIELCIFDPTYLALSCLLAPFPERLVCSDTNKTLIIRSSPEKNAPVDWVKAKVVNSLTLFKLLVHANDTQMKRIQGCALADRIDFYQADETWGLVLEIIENPESTIYQGFSRATTDLITVLGKVINGLGVDSSKPDMAYISITNHLNEVERNCS